MESYPLQWPLGWKRTTNPKRSRFGTYNSKPSIHKATQLVLSEIQKLIHYPNHLMNEITISTNLRLRNDGLPYSVQREPDDKGVAIYFKRNGEQMVIACDTFDKIGCNIYACALTIGAMRGIDRWGCSELLNRAFIGFKELPQYIPKKKWWEILEVPENSNAEVIKYAFRKKAKETHPDSNNNNRHEAFLEIKEAYEKALNSIIK